MSQSVTHIVQVSRRRHFGSTTLPSAMLARLETAFRAAPWWRDRWAHRGFRAEARTVLRESGGLVLMGPGLSFDAPPPFLEQFEPIEVARGLGEETERLRTLSGDAPTPQERFAWIVKVIFFVGGVGLVIVFALAFLGMLPRVVPLIIAGNILLLGVTLVVVFALRGLTGRWYLVPGAIAIVRRPVRRGLPPRVTVLARADTCLVLRYVHTGKTTILMAELWTHLGRIVRRPVTQREAMSILAAWQSPQTPPPDERLQELAWT